MSIPRIVTSRRDLPLVVFGRDLLITFKDDKNLVDVAIKPAPHAGCEVSHSAWWWPHYMVDELWCSNEYNVWWVRIWNKDSKMLNNHRLVTLSEASLLIDDGCRDWVELVDKESRERHSSLAPHHQQPSKQCLKVKYDLPNDLHSLCFEFHCHHLIWDGCMKSPRKQWREECAHVLPDLQSILHIHLSICHLAIYDVVEGSSRCGEWVRVFP